MSRGYPKYSERFGVTWRMDGPGEYVAEHEHMDTAVVAIVNDPSWGGPVWNGSITNDEHRELVSAVLA